MKRKETIYKGLRDIPVYIEDTSLLSESYFDITEFPTQLTAGKNLFKLKGNSEQFVANSEIEIEIIDFNGDPIYYEVVDFQTDDGSVIIAVYIYEETPSGDCTVYIVGEAVNVPYEWNGVKNIRWSRTCSVNAFAENTTEIVFDTLPIVNIAEQVGTHLNRTYSNGQFPTYSTGTVKYSLSYDDPILELSGGKFTGDMIGGTITISTPQNPTPTPNFTLSTTPYTATIRKVLSDSLIVLDTSYTVLHSASMTTHIYEKFDASAFSISYEATPIYTETQNSESFAIIEINGLQPATGDVSRIKTFMNNNGTVGTWELINDVELVETEIFVANTASLYPDQNIGSFTSQSVINTYWDAYTYIGNSVATAPTLTWSTSSLINAMRVSSSVDISASNAVYVTQIKSAYSATFVAGAEYKITLDAIGTSTNTSLPKLAVYLSGSAFNFDSTDAFNQQFPRPLGRRVGEIELDSNNQRLDDYVFNFEADNNGTATLLLVIENGIWQFSNIRTTTDNDVGYTPNYTRIRSLVPTAHKSGNQLSFKTEYYNVAGERSKQISYVYDKSWTGGNRYIDGDYSMITGSLYVADTLESGIAITGQRNTGYVRSLGYTGFDAGNPGFLIWSGSALSGSTSKGLPYSGVGIELYANTSSYFRYSTRDSELDVRTDKFFLGSVGQFISGANGNIEISSSGFHLDRAGNITASNGDFRGVNTADSYQFRVIEISNPATDPHISTYMSGSKKYVCINLTGSYDPTFNGGTSPAMFIKCTWTSPYYPIGAIKIHPDVWSDGRYQKYGSIIVLEGNGVYNSNSVFLARNATNPGLPDAEIRGGGPGSYDGDLFEPTYVNTTYTYDGYTYDGNVIQLGSFLQAGIGTTTIANRVMLVQSADYWTIQSFTNYSDIAVYYPGLYVQQVTGVGNPFIDFWAASGVSRIPFMYANTLYPTQSSIITIKEDNVYTGLNLQFASASGTTIGNIQFDSATYNMNVGTPLSKNLSLFTNNTPWVVISGSGEVGIDALADSVKFNVQTNAISGQEKIARFRVSDDTNSYMSIQNATTANNIFVPMLVGQNSSFSASLLILGRGAVDTGTAAITIFDSRVGDDTTNSAVATRPLFHWRNNGTVYMSMNATGSVGIGTTTPSAKLHVNNTTTLDSFLVEDSTNPDTTPFVIDNSGNVGIGTDTPAGKLTVSSSGANGINLGTDLLAGASKQSARLFFSNDTAGQGVAIFNVSGSMRFQTGATVGSSTGTTRMTLSGSNLGIAKTNPSAELDVNGDAFVSGSLRVSGSVTTTGSVTIDGSDITSAWTAYTPTWTAQGTQPAIGNGSITAAYKVIGKTCFYRGKLLLGSTSTTGTLGWIIRLPFTASAPEQVQIPVSMLDSGIAWYQGLMNGAYLGSATASAILCPTNTSASAGVSNTTPFTWGNADYLVWNGSYEIV